MKILVLLHEDSNGIHLHHHQISINVNGADQQVNIIEILISLSSLMFSPYNLMHQASKSFRVIGFVLQDSAGINSSILERRPSLQS